MSVSGFEGSILQQWIHQSEGFSMGMFRNVNDSREMGCFHLEVRTNQECKFKKSWLRLWRQHPCCSFSDLSALEFAAPPWLIGYRYMPLMR